MSLILVVARPMSEDAPDDAPAGAGRRLGWLTDQLGSSDELSVAYTAGPTEAVIAAEEALAEGRREVAFVPVAQPNGGGPTFPPGDLSNLEDLVARTIELHPDASVSLLGATADGPASFTDILAELHPTGGDGADLLAEAIGRAFGGDADRFGRFVRALQHGIPRGTQMALRGSAIQGYAYKSLEPFDARGPGTSDLDLVLLGDDAMAAWHPEAFVIPGVNTLPLDDRSTWVAPTIDPARSAAQSIARRPVAVQAMARWFLDLRSGLQDQPYVVLDA